MGRTQGPVGPVAVANTFVAHVCQLRARTRQQCSCIAVIARVRRNSNSAEIVNVCNFGIATYTTMTCGLFVEFNRVNPISQIFPFFPKLGFFRISPVRGVDKVRPFGLAFRGSVAPPGGYLVRFSSLRGYATSSPHY